MMAKAVMAEKDSDGDGELSKEEYDTMVEQAKSDGEWPGDFDADGTEGGFDGVGVAFEHVALDGDATDAEGGGFLLPRLK